MRRVGWWALLLAVTAVCVSGCGTTKRPYAHDPLLRDGQGIWGHPARNRTMDYPPATEPDAPRPPKPTELPTLEWETAKSD
jgi:hypothetical protein